MMNFFCKSSTAIFFLPVFPPYIVFSSQTYTIRHFSLKEAHQLLVRTLSISVIHLGSLHSYPVGSRVSLHKNQSCVKQSFDHLCGLWAFAFTCNSEGFSPSFARTSPGSCGNTLPRVPQLLGLDRLRGVRFNHILVDLGN